MRGPIAVVGSGDPRSPSTWSGTPAHICAALADAGRLGATLDSSAYGSASIRRLVHRISRLYYRSAFDTARGRFERARRARYAAAALRRADATDILHMGSFDLPLPSVVPAVRHYLYCDASWEMWRAGGSSAHAYTARQLIDADRLERIAYSQMTHLFTTGEYVKTHLIAHYGVSPELITVVGTGRGAIAPYAGPKDYASGAILFVAKERQADKGGRLLVEGFRLARERNPRLRLIMAGDDAHRETARDAPGVDVYSFVPLERLQTLFNDAALFAMPANHEPWGLAYLEALSCRTPVLGLARNALPEITQNGRFGFCVDVASPKRIAAALLDAFADPARLERMGTEGQAYVLNRFTWEGTVARMLKVIDAA